MKSPYRFRIGQRIRTPNNTTGVIVTYEADGRVRVVLATGEVKRFLEGMIEPERTEHNED
uniref:Uncharacterized protein n=1 Tax=viral metagenome TaxID=1070528 RepID=A0A6M3JLT4_9ZZZZ